MENKSIIQTEIDKFRELNSDGDFNILIMKYCELAKKIDDKLEELSEELEGGEYSHSTTEYIKKEITALDEVKTKPSNYSYYDKETKEWDLDVDKMRKKTIKIIELQEREEILIKGQKSVCIVAVNINGEIYSRTDSNRLGGKDEI